MANSCDVGIHGFFSWSWASRWWRLNLIWRRSVNWILLIVFRLGRRLLVCCNLTIILFNFNRLRSLLSVLFVFNISFLSLFHLFCRTNIFLTLFGSHFLFNWNMLRLFYLVQICLGLLCIFHELVPTCCYVTLKHLLIWTCIELATFFILNKGSFVDVLNLC